jgi:hypothetical protein
MAMPPCHGKTHGEIWELFVQHHGTHLSERELRATHQKWIRVAREAGFGSNHDTSRHHAFAPEEVRATDG